MTTGHANDKSHTHTHVNTEEKNPQNLVKQHGKRNSKKKKRK